MNEVIKINLRSSAELPKKFEDIRFSEELVQYCLGKYSKPGDVVLDPFVGYGTTVKVSEDMDRIGYGIEINTEVAEYARNQVSNPENIITDNSININHYSLPKTNLCLTSPYFMQYGNDNIFGPGSYEEFLNDLTELYKKISELLVPGGTVILEVPNLKTEKKVTPLAFDIVSKLSKIFNFEGETVINLEREYVSGYSFTYLLVFTKKIKY